MNWKQCERSRWWRNFTYVLYPRICLETLSKTPKTSVSITRLRIDIRIQEFQNKKQEYQPVDRNVKYVAMMSNSLEVSPSWKATSRSATEELLEMKIIVELS
jgi:hypothetical protein